MKINVLRPFTLNLPKGQGQRKFEVGTHDVDEAIANHWYVRAHCEGQEGQGGQDGKAADKGKPSK